MSTTNGRVKAINPIPDKLKPHNVEAEDAYLGCIILSSGDTIIETAKLGIVPGDFMIERNAWVFDEAKELVSQNKPVDILLLADGLERKNRLDQIGGIERLHRLMGSVPSSAFGMHYGEIIKRASVMRQLINGAGEISRIAYQDEIDSQAAIESATEILLNISKSNVKNKDLTLMELGQKFLDRLEQLKNSENGITGFPTGLTDLDKLLGGLQPADFIVLAGRPSMGKSALALQIAIEGAINYNARTVIFTREMSSEALHQRMVSYISGVDVQRLRTGRVKDSEYSAIIDATARIANLPIVIDSESATPEQMRARAIIEKEKNGLDLVIVDYLQKVVPNDQARRFGNKSNEIGEISGGLNRIAKDLNIPVLTISSLSRACESRPDKRPHLADLRESGDIEYDADVVIFIYRDEVYTKEDSIYPNLAELNVEKQRQGPLGGVMVYFQKDITRFNDLTTQTEPLDWVK